MSILSVVGKLTRGLRAGEERLIRHRPDFEGLPVSIQVTSPAFADGQPMPAKYTVSGEDVSPPLAWSNLQPHVKPLGPAVYSRSKVPVRVPSARTWPFMPYRRISRVACGAISRRLPKAKSWKT